MNRIVDLYTTWKGCPPASAEKLAGAGSNRTYYRLHSADGSSVIGCIGTSIDENRAFISLSRHFCSKALPVPRVLAVSSDELCYLQTDLGSTSLFDAISRGRKAGGNYDAKESELLVKTIRLLPRIQFEGAEGLDFSVCYPQPSFDAMGVMFDLNYFKYCFLKPSGVDFHEVRLEADFQLLTRHLTAHGHASAFLYRDFQARNVMLSASSEPYFIDFQGGRRGPFYYDLASFLWQASARYPDALRLQLLDVYYAEASHYAELPERETFDARLRLFVFFRLLQVLGAYGFRGYFERKAHFIDSIPYALDNLQQVLQATSLPYPCLVDTLNRLIEAKQEKTENDVKDGVLQVRIFSFSYKKGIPADPSGNGGGYVFDCRGTNNPGRYAEYKHLTGLDAPVIKFLEDDGEIVSFLDSVYKLADKHVSRYLERGFTSLMFSFGCTGGQHRSVYAAQHLADHIKKMFPMVKVVLHHREQEAD